MKFMKFTTIFSLLPAAATASKGIHLRITPVVEETTPDVFQSIVEVLNQCPEQTAALAMCYGGHPNMLACGDCAWKRIIDEINLGCTDIDAIATADYSSCIDDLSSTCNSDCGSQALDVWTCARALYCGSDEEDFLETSAEDGTGCFSLESTVDVQGKGTIAIKDLEIGDMVLSDEQGTYSMYYSSGHFSGDKSTAFLQIFTETSTKKPLEVTKNHLVYKDTEALPVPAHSIKVGDILKTIHGSSKVTVIKKVTRKGLTNPFTMSGTIVVDGVVASTLMELPGFGGQESGWVYIMNRKLVHWHSLIHFTLAPHRIVCGRLMSCDESNLSEDGFVPYVSYLYKFHQVATEKKSTFLYVAILSFVVTQSILFALVEVLIQHLFASMLIVLGVAGAKWFFTKKIKSSSKAKSA